MARNFLIHDETSQEDVLIEALASREKELADYDKNVDNYTKQLASTANLPAGWPPEIAQLRGKTDEQIATMDVTDAQALLASMLNHRDRIKLLIFTESAAMRRSEKIYAAIVEQFPDGPKRQAAIGRFKAKPKK